jgi:hypothetical protein
MYWFSYLFILPVNSQMLVLDLDDKDDTVIAWARIKGRTGACRSCCNRVRVASTGRNREGVSVSRIRRNSDCVSVGTVSNKRNSV